MKHLVKQSLRHVSPRLLDTISAFRADRRNQDAMRRNGSMDIARRLVARHGAQVLGGPFAGMTYLSSSIGSAYLPKLIGSYECELHPVIERALANGYDTVVDVGCAEGYYAVGLARRLDRAARIHAFDLYPAARRQCRLMARLNAVDDRVRVGGFCDTVRLNAVLGERPGRPLRTLVVCDCEGYERDLLRPDAAPGLVTSDLIIEMHDFLDPSISGAIVERFRDTHAVTVIRAREREPHDFPVLSFLSPEEQKLALWEMRPPAMEWAFLTARVWESATGSALNGDGRANNARNAP